MIDGTVETKAHLFRENGRWVISLDLPVWLNNDLTQELNGYALVNMSPLLKEDRSSSEQDLVQMPLAETGMPCPNCQTIVKLVTVPEQKGWKDLWSELWLLLRPS